MKMYVRIFLPRVFILARMQGGKTASSFARLGGQIDIARLIEVRVSVCWSHPHFRVSRCVLCSVVWQCLFHVWYHFLYFRSSFEFWWLLSMFHTTRMHLILFAFLFEICCRLTSRMCTCMRMRLCWLRNASDACVDESAGSNVIVVNICNIRSSLQ